MGLHHPFGHLKHKLWPKEGSGVKLVVWLPITESRESTQFACVQVACNIPLKSSRRGLLLWFRAHLHWRSACKKLWHPKVTRVLTLAISGLPLRSLGTKSHLDVGPMGSHKVYYKGEGVGFPQVRAMVNLVSLNRLWFVLAPKVFQLCINHLVLVLCKPVWVSETCQFFLIPSRSFNTPLYLSKMLRVRKRVWFFALSLFSIWDSYLNPSKS